MQSLSRELASIEKTRDMEELERARKLIARLRSMNNRWNIASLNDFLRERMKELFYNL